MTIKELEQTVGMTRSNIRFYESEGLLTPARGANGYRDYAQADVETLEKIKLLRRLGVELEAIRALQSGEAELETVLTQRLSALDRDRNALEQAQAVCEALCRGGENYVNLQPRPWLDQLDRSPASRPVPREDQAPPPPGHPWRRYFAQGLDLALCGLPILLFEIHVLHVSLNSWSNSFQGFINRCLAYLVLFLLEPLMLHYWATTPGKALLGIAVHNADGGNLSVEEARSRFLARFRYGEGWGLPFYGLYRLYKSYQTAQAGEPLPWEQGSRGHYEHMAVTGGGERWVGWACVRLGAIALSALILLSAFLPPNRGELTLEEFRENYNYYCDFLDLGAYMEADGSIQGRTRGGVLVTSLDTTYITRRWEPITEEGRTVGFRYLVEAQGWTLEKLLDQDTGVLTYVGSQAGLGFVREVDDWLNVIPDELGRENGRWEFDFVRNGYRLTQTADVTVPEGAQSQLSDSWTTLYPQGTQARVNLVFEVRRV